MTRFLDSLEEEELTEILKALDGMQAVEALDELLERAKETMAGREGSGLGATDQAALERALMKTLLGGAAGRSPGVGPGGEGEGMGNEGRAAGGEAGVGEDPGEVGRPTRIRGKLDPTGRLGKKIPFKGIPKEKDALEAFAETLGQAAADVEESLGRDEIAPGARPFVRRYFESLKHESRDRSPPREKR